MARLYEYQGKELFRKYGIAIPRGKVISSEGELKDAFKEIGVSCMIKSQVLSGKRGKAGLIRLASSLEEAVAISKELLGKKLQYGKIEKLLIEERLPIEKEYYVGITADPAVRQPVILFTKAGGMDVEGTAEKETAVLHKKYVNILKGISEDELTKFLKETNDWPKEDMKALVSVVSKLYKIYRELDCRLVEINPLVSTAKGYYAADARVDIDDDAMARHKDLGIELAEETGDREPTILEIEASKIDDGDHRGSVHFVQIDPDGVIAKQKGLISIGFDCVGTGTSLTTLDELVEFGFFPVNFADTSGNPTASKMYRATKIILAQPRIQGYLFVSCMSSQQLDNTARGIIKAMKEIYPETGGKPNIPTVLCFRGGWDEDAIRLFDEHGISKSPLVKVLGRYATELEAVQMFDAIYKNWAAERKAEGVS